ncbi:MAG TPA: hypothetical protein VHR66_26025 [Gemmataceae bacterium]|jgi:hypothetical protein|nr:hypothetical protein [Gemmataceae bacterium]
MAQQLGEIQYAMEGTRPVVELVVPHGTKLLDLAKATDSISKQLLPKIGPRGCQACISGVHFTIRERLENVVQVDLETGKIQSH